MKAKPANDQKRKDERLNDREKINDAKKKRGDTDELVSQFSESSQRMLTKTLQNRVTVSNFKKLPAPQDPRSVDQVYRLALSDAVDLGLQIKELKKIKPQDPADFQSMKHWIEAVGKLYTVKNRFLQTALQAQKSHHDQNQAKVLDHVKIEVLDNWGAPTTEDLENMERAKAELSVIKGGM